MLVDVNGLKLHVQTHGKPENPAVVLAHSLGSDMSTWDRLVPVLNDRYYVIRMDMRGHGQSGIAGDYSFHDLASDVVGILDHLKVDKANFIGLSMGGMIAQALGLYYPGRLLSLTIMASMSSVGENRQMWQDRISDVSKNGLEPLVQSTLERWFTQKAFKEQPELIEKVGKLISRTSVKGYQQACKAISELDFTGDLNKITVPALIIVGAEDQGTPPALSEIMHKEISGSKFCVVEGAAHQVALECAEEVNRLVTDFLSDST